MEKESTQKRTCLTAQEYHEWRMTIMGLWLAEERLKSASLEHKVLQRDAEILHTRTQLFFKSVVEAKRTRAAEAKGEYQKLKEKLEGSLGYSLNGKLIDDITFEITDAPEEPQTNNKG